MSTATLELSQTVPTDARSAIVHTAAQVGIAAGFSMLVGPTLAAIWLAASFTHLRASTWVLTALIRRGSKRANAWAMLHMISANLAIGAIALAAVLKAGLWGLLNGQMLLMCLIINAVATARGRKASLLAALAPTAACMFLLLAFAPRGPMALAGALSFALGIGGAIAFAIEAHRQMAASASAVLAANDAKSNFLALVSHELRTPLNGILATAAQLAATARSPRARVEAALIADSGQMMRTLLDDLLDLSKAEAGQMTVEVVAFDLRRLIHDTSLFWRGPVQAKGLRLGLIGAHATPRWVESDPTRLRQILNNLVSNAMKFTDQGAVTIRIGWSSVSAAAGRLTISVEDTGPGLDATQLGRLFRPYDQGAASTARTHGGTGLGLALSRELARGMGGDLIARSIMGQGARFDLEIPLTLGVTPSKAALSTDTSSPEPETLDQRLAGARCLVVDDHPLNWRVMEAILTPIVAHVAYAESGQAALTILAREPFDVVLMDLNMPGLDGLETTRRLRAQETSGQTPVLALSGATSEAEARACLAAGMNGVLHKPIEIDRLLAALDAALTPAMPAMPAKARRAGGRSARS